MHVSGEASDDPGQVPRWSGSARISLDPEVVGVWPIEGGTAAERADTGPTRNGSRSQASLGCAPSLATRRARLRHAPYPAGVRSMTRPDDERPARNAPRKSRRAANFSLLRLPN